ncbi:MAG: hypothetical protein C0613_12565 [Desulfobulbaceae bacterium]|nr:MAG: hypothetical protein C0613_12565 [Desulfobulbaceae bacterium]
MDPEHFALELAIPCACGQLEGRLFYGDRNQQGPGLIICPPHPLLAGNMENNVLQAIAATMAPAMPVLLFNYRAVGKSSRPRPDLPLYEYWHGLDQNQEYAEVISEVGEVLSWARRYFNFFHLAGYSFGAYVALKAARPDILSYLAITPPLAEHDFSALATLTCPMAFILAEKDGLLEVGGRLPAAERCLVRTIQATDHFFIKREREVAEFAREFWTGL